MTKTIIYTLLLWQIAAVAFVEAAAESLFRDWSNIILVELDHHDRSITSVIALKGQALDAESIERKMGRIIFSKQKAESPNDYARLLILSSDFRNEGGVVIHRSCHVWLNSEGVGDDGYGEFRLADLFKLSGMRADRNGRKQE